MRQELAEQLHCLTEEACEVGQITQKIQRFGMSCFNPDDPNKTTNHDLLEHEVGHFLYIVEMMVALGALRVERLCQSMQHKAKKLPRFTHYQEDFPDPCSIIFAHPIEAQRPRPSHLNMALEDITEAMKKFDGMLTVRISPTENGWALRIHDTHNKADVAVFEGETVDQAVHYAHDYVLSQKK